MRDYYNIESRKPMSTYRLWPYAGYAADGAVYHAQKVIADRKQKWRFVLVRCGKPTSPTQFYTRTLEDASMKLDAMGVAK